MPTDDGSSPFILAEEWMKPRMRSECLARPSMSRRLRDTEKAAMTPSALTVSRMTKGVEPRASPSSSVHRSHLLF